MTIKIEKRKKITLLILLMFIFQNLTFKMTYGLHKDIDPDDYTWEEEDIELDLTSYHYQLYSAKIEDNGLLIEYESTLPEISEGAGRVIVIIAAEYHSFSSVGTYGIIKPYTGAIYNMKKNEQEVILPSLPTWKLYSSHYTEYDLENPSKEYVSHLLYHYNSSTYWTEYIKYYYSEVGLYHKMYYGIDISSEKNDYYDEAQDLLVVREYVIEYVKNLIDKRYKEYNVNVKHYPSFSGDEAKKDGRRVGDIVVQVREKTGKPAEGMTVSLFSDDALLKEVFSFSGIAYPRSRDPDIINTENTWKSEVANFDWSEFTAKSTDETGTVVFNYLEQMTNEGAYHAFSFHGEISGKLHLVLFDYPLVKSYQDYGLPGINVHTTIDIDIQGPAIIKKVVSLLPDKEVAITVSNDAYPRDIKKTITKNSVGHCLELGDCLHLKDGDIIVTEWFNGVQMTAQPKRGELGTGETGEVCIGLYDTGLCDRLDRSFGHIVPMAVLSGVSWGVGLSYPIYGSVIYVPGMFFGVIWTIYRYFTYPLLVQFHSTVFLDLENRTASIFNIEGQVEYLNYTGDSHEVYNGTYIVVDSGGVNQGPELFDKSGFTQEQVDLLNNMNQTVEEVLEIIELSEETLENMNVTLEETADLSTLQHESDNNETENEGTVTDDSPEDNNDKIPFFNTLPFILGFLVIIVYFTQIRKRADL